MSGIEDEIKEEIASNKILIYGKGTKTAPQCGFTVEVQPQAIGQTTIQATNGPVSAVVVSPVTGSVTR